MKWLCIITLVIVCLGGNLEMCAQIKNGYDHEVIEAQKKMNHLREIAKNTLNKVQRKRLKKNLKATRAAAKKIRENHAKTQELIEMFRMIDPGLYHEINTIKDCEGNDTHVYIKVVDELKSGLVGATNVNQSVENPNVYSSEYGDHTVSVKIRYRFLKEAMITLVHELGHVRYQVPHLAEYTAFYKEVYQDTNLIGHLSNDPSHHAVKETLKTFKASWSEYNRERRWLAQFISKKILASTQKKDQQ